MAHALMLDTPGTSRPSKRRKLGVPVVLQVVAMIGIGALVYPAAADWFATLSHNSERSGYVRTVEGLSEAQLAEGLSAARDYNANLPAGALIDPYSATGDPVAAAADQASYSAYEDVLRASDNGVIGEVVYPRLGIGLPLFHGTGDDAISRGVGHLYGSSLPVGGESTHSVLTSHSGLVHASLFTKLPQAKVGDLFEVRVLGETRYYEVDGLETVEPFVTDSLNVVDGEDRVTLFTCTPIGVNSHRFLVHGVRVPAPPGAGDTDLAGDGLSAGFPWWAAAFVGGSGVVAYLLFAPRRTKKRAGATINIDTDEKRKS
ncbi:class C sortase [Leucobacter aridicollis]|uniref:class C sortase n=1 Tax=Leucobacter aridicollis TaxID=283878 RepID=UPI002102CB32|nr:class C sortase [Leucobacter aridicollis]